MLAPACRVLVCDDCAEYYDTFFTSCEDCGAQACPAHTLICTRCNTLGRGETEALGLYNDHRAMMQCCACQRVYCRDCDPGPGGRAGEQPSRDDEREAPDASTQDCVFCVSWPRACGGRVAAHVAIREEDADVAKEEAQEAAEEAEDLAAQAAADATAASVAAAVAAVAVAAADAAARTAAQSAAAAAEAAEEAAAAEAELADADALLDEARAAARW